MMCKIRATMLIADKFLGENLIETKIALIHIVFSFKVILPLNNRLAPNFGQKFIYWENPYPQCD